MEAEATEITATELARSLSDVLNRVRYRKERFVVKRNGERIAVIEAAESARSPARTFREIFARIGDLQMPGHGFADDVEVAHAAQGFPNFPKWPD